MFELTEQPLVNKLSNSGQPDFAKLARMPCLFMNEGTGVEVCRVGHFTCTHIVGREVVFDYTLDPEIPAIENSLIFANRLASTCRMILSFRRITGQSRSSTFTKSSCLPSVRAGNARVYFGSRSMSGSNPNSCRS